MMELKLTNVVYNSICFINFTITQSTYW